MGGGVGIVLAGPIVAHLNYHWLFWIPLVIGHRRGDHGRTSSCPSRRCAQPGRISWSAAVLLSAWLVGLLLGVSEAPAWGWGSTRVLGPARAGRAVLLVAWVVVRVARRRTR